MRGPLAIPGQELFGDKGAEGSLMKWFMSDGVGAAFWSSAQEDASVNIPEFFQKIRDSDQLHAAKKL